MSALRKLILGPTAQTPCRHCGLAVGVAVGPALIALAPCMALVVFVLMEWMRDPALMVASAVASIAVACALYLFWVPLVRRQVTHRAAVEAALRAASGAKHQSPD